MSSIYGTHLRLSLFGQSHAPAVGAVLDGLPAGFPIDFDALCRFLGRRAPGRSPLASSRQEADLPEILCGLAEGKTCGAPLTVLIRNGDARPADYAALRDLPRPGHADYPAGVKYRGFQDAAGGGHFSGRLTAPLCAAGGICLQILQTRGISVFAHIASVGTVADRRFDPVCPELPDDPGFPVLDSAAGERMKAEIADAAADGDSVGGTVECAVTGLPAGLGDPMLDGMENRLAQLLFAIPAVRGLEFGSGFAGSAMRGSEHNDPYTVSDGLVRTLTNRHGGILGGITTGMPLVFRLAVKPTPSVARPQQTVSLAAGSPATLEIRGRHDPCIVPRAVPCVEAAAAVAVLDALLTAQADGFSEGASL